MHSKEDSSGVTSAPLHAPSPGQMLRAAREAKGLHLAVLSVALKVPTRQLEALENDRHDAFKGTIFVRALAQAVCRHLGVDPAPVLAGLPKTASPLAVPSSASTPVAAPVSVKWGSDRALGNRVSKGVSRWVLWLAVLMLLGAAALIWWPQSPQDALPGVAAPAEVSVEAAPQAQASDAAEVPASAAPAASSAQAVMAPVVVSQPAPVAASAAPQVQAQGVAAATESPLLIQASADAWVAVRDSRGQIVLNRRVKAGESVKLDMSPPLFVYAGRSDGIDLMWRGQAVDLKPHTQNNEIRLFIKP